MSDELHDETPDPALALKVCLGCARALPVGPVSEGGCFSTRGKRPGYQARCNECRGATARAVYAARKDAPPSDEPPELEGATWEEIGRAIGTTGKRAEQIAKGALEKLRRIAEARGITREDLH